VLHFCDYSYANGHRGVYPLDVNEAGVLRKLAGGYDIEESYLTKWPEEEEDDGFEKEDEDENRDLRELKHCDRAYLEAKKRRDEKSRKAPESLQYFGLQA